MNGDKQGPQLTDPQLEEINDSLRSAFNPREFRRMLRLELGILIEDEVDTRQGFRYVVQDVLDLAVRRGWAGSLLRGARKQNPDNTGLARTVRRFGFDLSPPPASDQPPQQRLEKLVTERSSFINYRAFSDGLSRLGPRICRIECPEDTPLGTGWLVGPNLVLTAYHVIEGGRDGSWSPSSVRCRFNFVAPDNAGAAPAPDDRGQPRVSLVGLADDWLVDWAPYSKGDVVADGPEPTNDELDYALVRLLSAAGQDALPTGEERGWFAVPRYPPALGRDDFMLVAQHAAGRELELSFGEVQCYNGASNRLRYDTSTEPGSSGAPCLTLELEPFGIHHASGPGAHLKFNQCVPLRRVLSRMEQREVAPFWHRDP